jgi:hypothetical protein
MSLSIYDSCRPNSEYFSYEADFKNNLTNNVQITNNMKNNMTHNMSNNASKANTLIKESPNNLNNFDLNNLNYSNSLDNKNNQGNEGMKTDEVNVMIVRKEYLMTQRNNISKKKRNFGSITDYEADYFSRIQQELNFLRKELLLRRDIYGSEERVKRRFSTSDSFHNRTCGSNISDSLGYGDDINSGVFLTKNYRLE